MRARRSSRYRTSLGLLALAASPAVCQQPLRGHYLEMIPPAPPIVAASAATERFGVYGDRSRPEFIDLTPMDGIDDAQATRLARLADRFSPLLRRNNFSIPRRFDVIPGGTTLHIDEWRNGALRSSDSIVMDGRVAGRQASRLRELVDLLGPQRPYQRVVQPRLRDETVLFLDFPGTDEPSWRTAHAVPSAPPHAYAHVFVDEAPDSHADARYSAIIQYWFFYPFNDATNNHEGDWEHLNVHVTSRRRFAQDSASRRTSLLDSGDVARMVGAAADMPLDSLVISRVDYYFHHSVVVVDYATAHVRPALTPHAEHATTHIWEDAGYVTWNVRQRLTAANGRIATHPVGYIGGESRGPGELLRARPRLRAAYNANSHGTYPFPGVWVSVGQLGATERLAGRVVPRTRAAPADSPWQALIDDPDFVVFGAGDITLLPDWERVVPLMDDSTAAVRWAWLLLPIHFGFPTSASPGAGTIGRVNLGNAAPLGPTYHPGWNLGGATGEHHPHAFTVLRGPAAPAGPWLALQQGWGVLNLPLAAWGLMPGYNVLATTLVPYFVAARRILGNAPERTLYRGALPPRVTMSGYGVFHERGRIEPSLSHRWTGQRAWFDLYFGERFAMQNTFAWGAGTARYSRPPGTAGGPQPTGDIRYRRLTGGGRYNVLSADDGTRQLFVRGGYGWSEYRLGAVVAGTDTLTGTGGQRGTLPSLLPSRNWWPNSAYAGLGVELFAPRRYWVLHRTGYGVRAELTGARARRGVRTTDVAMAFMLGW